MSKRNKNNITGESGEILIDKIITESGWVCNKLIRDYGIDFHVKIFIDGVSTPFDFHAQVKSSTIIKSRNGKYVLNLSKEKINDYILSEVPIVIFFADLKEEMVYYSLVNYQQENINYKKNGKTKVEISKSNIFNKGNIQPLITSIQNFYFQKNVFRIINYLEASFSKELGGNYDNKIYSQPLPLLEIGQNNACLFHCFLCGNFFWHNKNIAIEDEFTKIYNPLDGEPPVYCCDFPEIYCPFCSTGKGALTKCKKCSEYRVEIESSLENSEDGDICPLCFISS